MSKTKRVLRCYHCGSILQSKNSNEDGFISKDILASAPKIPYCNKCFEKMQSLNSGYLDLTVEDDVLKILDDAVATDAIIIWVVDLFTFCGLINPDIAKKVKKLKVCVIGNKRNLFSSTINNQTFVRYINERFEAAGIKPAAVRIYNDARSIPVEQEMAKLKEFRQGHDVYMIGSEQCGKTTIINALLKAYNNNTKWNINTELYPDTNVRVLEIPLDNSSFFYELPGWPLSASVVTKVEKDVNKVIVAKKKSHAFRFSLSNNETLMVGGLAAFTLVKGKQTAMKFCGSEVIETKKIPAGRLATLLEENQHNRMVRPVSDRFTNFTDYEVFDVEMDKDNQMHDIYIDGLCWISFAAKGQTVRVMLPKGVALVETLAKVR